MSKSSISLTEVNELIKATVAIGVIGNHLRHCKSEMVRHIERRNDMLALKKSIIENGGEHCDIVDNVAAARISMSVHDVIIQGYIDSIEGLRDELYMATTIIRKLG